MAMDERRAVYTKSIVKKTVTTIKLIISNDELIEMVRNRYPELTENTEISGDINNGEELYVVMTKEEVERNEDAWCTTAK